MIFFFVVMFDITICFKDGPFYFKHESIFYVHSYQVFDMLKFESMMVRRIAVKVSQTKLNLSFIFATGSSAHFAITVSN
ncbi:unnamed protein product [Mucor hiemalis]